MADWEKDTALAVVRRAGPVVTCRSGECDPTVNYGPLLNSIAAALRDTDAAAYQRGFNCAMESREHTIESLYHAIAHGDDEHRRWLKEAIDAHFDGRPVPQATGNGTAAAAYQRGRESVIGEVKRIELAATVSSLTPLGYQNALQQVRDLCCGLAAALADGGKDG